MKAYRDHLNEALRQRGSADPNIMEMQQAIERSGWTYCHFHGEYESPGMDCVPE